MKKIIVVDLDGCLCTRNTFRIWLVSTYLYLFLSLRWVSFTKFNIYILFRLLRISDRVRMKRDVLAITEGISPVFVDWFCRYLHMFTNPDVIEMMNSCVDSDRAIVLCTAAPSCYVDAYAAPYSFDSVLATSSVAVTDWKENIREEKLDSVLRHFGDDVSIECVVTDHHDDLPLLLRSKRRVLVRPTQQTIESIADRFDFEVL